MNRRNFVKTAATAAGLVASSISGFANALLSTEYDKYGGWTGKRLTTTGFFHTEHDGNRWWFVTPDGNVFLSWGINHYHDGWWTQDYNRDHWVNKFGATKPRDEKWNKGFRKAANNDLSRLGINTLGWHTDALMLTDKPYKAVVPYLRSFKPVALDHYICPKKENFVDIFSSEFEKICNQTAQRVVAPYADDPMLLGYCMSDCPPFTENEVNYWCAETTWSRSLRNLSTEAPGKQMYVKTMQKRYSDISAFNKIYKTSFVTWNDLSETENWRVNKPASNKNELADSEAFTLLCVDKYYEVSKAAIQRYDRNHLFFGDKLNGNTDNMDKVLEVVAKHVDVIGYQFYGTLDQQNYLLDKLIPRIDIPFINGDIGFTVCYDMMPNPHGPHAKDQAERAAWLLESVEACFARPEFIGWHMCGIIDTWKTMPTKEKAQHQGLMTVTGEFYPEMEEAVKTISSGMYRIATNE